MVKSKTYLKDTSMLMNFFFIFKIADFALLKIQKGLTAKFSIIRYFFETLFK